MINGLSGRINVDTPRNVKLPLGSQPNRPIMSKNTRYILLSLPSSVTPSGDRDDVLGAVRTTIGADAGSVSPFAVPEFKIGTLDALVQQADDLARAAGQCEGVVAKVGEALRSVLDGDDEQVARMKTVNDSMDNPLGKGGDGERGIGHEC